MLDRLLPHSPIVRIQGDSNRLKEKRMAGSVGTQTRNEGRRRRTQPRRPNRAWVM